MDCWKFAMSEGIERWVIKINHWASDPMSQLSVEWWKLTIERAIQCQLSVEWWKFTIERAIQCQLSVECVMHWSINIEHWAMRWALSDRWEYLLASIRQKWATRQVAMSDELWAWASDERRRWALSDGNSVITSTLVDSNNNTFS